MLLRDFISFPPPAYVLDFVWEHSALFGTIRYILHAILSLDTPNAKQQKARSQMKEKVTKGEYAIKWCIYAKRDQKVVLANTLIGDSGAEVLLFGWEKGHVTIIVLSWYYVRKTSFQIVIQELSVCD